MQESEIIRLLTFRTLAFNKALRRRCVFLGGRVGAFLGQQCHQLYIQDDPETWHRNLNSSPIQPTSPCILQKLSLFHPSFSPTGWNVITSTHVYQSRIPSLLLSPLELQAIRMRFRQEVRNAQQNLIRQIGLWRRTGGEHPTSVNNAWNR